ncbi:AAA family ATPase [Tardiphaga sp. 172_B4_N1_3]|uniref:AAA family ATPase n=1 Tax=Tardiphaga sp. 172_B4_N1_3 TaxID=3240787 RepID=UPI003F8C5E5E
MSIVDHAGLDNVALDNIAMRHDQRQERNRAGFRYELMSEFGVHALRKNWILKGILARGETTAWVGKPGSLKSALMADLCLAVAGGKDWRGNRSKAACGVVYFALERVDLVRRRLRAGWPPTESDPPIAVVPETMNLMDLRTVERVIAIINDVNERIRPHKVGLIVIDTFAKAIAAGGGDENSAKDQGVCFANLARIKSATSVHVAIVGHTGKDEARGMRGSNASYGDVDVMVEISGDQVKTATVTKANDRPEGPLLSFGSKIIELGVDEDGDPVTVNIVSQEAVETGSGGSETVRLTANQQTFYRILYDAGDRGLALEEWNEQARQAGLGERRRADLLDLRKALLDKRLVRESGGRWYIDHT